MKFQYDIGGKKKEVIITEISREKGFFEVKVAGKSKVFTVRSIPDRNFIILDKNNRVYDVFVDRGNNGHCVSLKGVGLIIKEYSAKQNRTGFEVTGKAVTKSPLPGQVKNILKNAGDKVAQGEGILILEAMKMENEIKSPKTGILSKLFVEKNSSVNGGEDLFLVE